VAEWRGCGRSKRAGGGKRRAAVHGRRHPAPAARAPLVLCMTFCDMRFAQVIISANTWPHQGGAAPAGRTSTRTGRAQRSGRRPATTGMPSSNGHLTERQLCCARSRQAQTPRPRVTSTEARCTAAFSSCPAGCPPVPKEDSHTCAISATYRWSVRGERGPTRVPAIDKPRPPVTASGVHEPSRHAARFQHLAIHGVFERRGRTCPVLWRAARAAAGTTLPRTQQASRTAGRHSQRHEIQALSHPDALTGPGPSGFIGAARARPRWIVGGGRQRPSRDAGRRGRR
jgi:hypothetical protein